MRGANKIVPIEIDARTNDIFNELALLMKNKIKVYLPKSILGVEN